MKVYYFLIIFILLISCSQNKKNKDFPFDVPKDSEVETTTYYFVRHAEKDTTDSKNNDPLLTDEGLRRANYLAQYFENKSLDMFYSTDYIRTLQTLIPTVHYFKGEIKNYNGKDENLFNADFWKSTYGKKTLVVGHSNTSPRFVNEILGTKKYKPLKESNYDMLYKVEINKNLFIQDTIIKLKVPEDFSYNPNQ